MSKYFWTFMLIYIAGWGDYVSGEESDDKCVLSLVIPKNSIKTSCDKTDEYHKDQKFRSIESQLNNLRRKVNDLQVKLTYTLTKAKSDHEHIDIEERLAALETTVPQLQKLVTNLEANLSSKVMTRNHGNNDKASPEEPYSRKKLGRIIKSILRKELVEFKKAIKEEFLNEVGNQIKSDLKNELLTFIKKDGKLIHEINSQILLNNFVNDNFDETDEMDGNVRTEKPYSKLERRELSREVYDASRSALDNEFPEQIQSRSYRSNTKQVNLNTEVNTIRLEILRHQNKQTDIVNTLLTQVKSKLEELNAAKQSFDIKNDKKMKRLQSEIEETKKKLDSIVQNIETLADGIQSLQQNMLDNYDKIKSELSATERSINSKINVKSNPYSSEMEYLKNQTMAAERYQRMTESSLRNMIADIRLKHHYMEENITTMSQSIKVLNETVNPSYEDAFDLEDAMHQLDISDAVGFFQDIKDSWPLVIGNLTSMEQIYKKDTDTMQEKLGEIAYKFETVLRNNTSLNDKTEQVQTEIKALQEKVKSMEKAMREKALENNEWAPYNFNHTYDCSGCTGGQKFVKKTGYNVGMYVGVTLCSSTRYKIYLSDSLHETFLNIGDTRGFGKDHCEFVGSERNASIAVNGDYPVERTTGYKRADWGQIPVKGLLSFFFSTPLWYECGITIP